MHPRVDIGELCLGSESKALEILAVVRDRPLLACNRTSFENLDFLLRQWERRDKKARSLAVPQSVPEIPVSNLVRCGLSLSTQSS